MNEKKLLERNSRQKRIIEMCDQEKENPPKSMSFQTFNSIGIQCSKLEEKLLIDGEDSQTSSYYWK
jgi:hypothetical protein